MNFIVSIYDRYPMNIRIILACAVLLASLTGCEELGIPDAKKDAERKQAEGEAIGSACRHAGRSLEDCYARNPRAPKAAIFSGWRSMNDYMIENKLEIVPPPADATPGTHDSPPADADAPAEAHGNTHTSAPSRQGRRTLGT